MHFLQHQITQEFKYPKNRIMPESVSVITGSYNHARFFRSLVHRLVNCQEILPEKYEIVVGDTGSNKENQDIFNEILEEYKGKVLIKYVYINKNNMRHIPHFHAWSFSINAAIKASVGDIVVYCDSQILVPPRLISSLASPHMEADNIFIRSKTLNFSHQETDVAINEDFYKKPWNEILSLVSKKKYSLGRTSWGVRREALIKVGGADERFTHYGCHDDDMILRLMLNGYKNMMADVECIHQRHEDTDRNATDRYNETILKNNLNKKLLVANCGVNWGSFDWIKTNA